jgi:SAM-dependent MidA family methyltransferase
LPIADVLTREIHERGPITVAAFMNLALYHPEFGYYARAVQRSGRAGDFFTSVDVGPLFGRLLASQIAEMAAVLSEARRCDSPDAEQAPGAARFELVEAGAGNGRLAADVLQALQRDDAGLYQRTHLHLVEASPRARAAQQATLGGVADRLDFSSPDLPESFEGVLVANELLDAMPVHRVVMRDTGLREIYVDSSRGTLREREGPLSTPRLGDYFASIGVTLERGWRADVSLQAIDWVRSAARRLTRGFVVLVDYGHQARQLYSVAHSAGTLTSYTRHTASGPESASAGTSWLRHPGDQDLTAHVDFTSVKAAAEAEGCCTLGFLDQSYFLVALCEDRLGSLGLRERLALKTLIMPGGLGSTMKVLVLGKGVGQPRLTGCPPRARLT